MGEARQPPGEAGPAGFPPRPTLRVLGADPLLRWACLAGLGWLAGYAIFTAVNRRAGVTEAGPLTVLYLVPIALAAAMCVLAGLRTRGRQRLAWGLFFVSNTLWLTGEVIWSWYSFTSDDVPTPSIADVYALSYPVALAAILVGLGPGNVLRHARGLLDASLVAVGFGALGWKLVIGPMVPVSYDPEALISFVYPFTAVLLVSAVIAVGVAGYRTAPLWVSMCGVGFAVSGLSDAQYVYLVVQDAYTESSWLDLGWQAAAVMLSLAPLAAVRHPEPPARRRRSDRDVAIVPSLVSAATVGVLVATDLLRGDHVEGSSLVVAGLLAVGLLVRQAMVTRDRSRLAAQLRAALGEQRRLAVTDGLTGLYNRRFFQETLELEAERAIRRGWPLSLMLVDLDHFKTINDSYGHPAGDAVLARVAERLRAAVRGTDVIARYGGEEFVCLLPGSDAAMALEVAEKVRRSVCAGRILVRPGVEVQITASVGVATAGGDHPAGHGVIDTERLINEADDALYRAKARGRNRTVSADSLLDLELDTDPELPPALVWLADQVDAKLSPEEHSTAVARWAVLTGERLGLDPATLRRAAAAGRLHDLGKINVAAEILSKPGRLTDEEWRQLCRHPDEGGRLLTDYGGRPDLAPLVAAHHERYDGGGYPRGLAGEEIPIEARIIAVCDAWAAMRSRRHYAPALDVAEARTQIERGRGSQFDPKVADAFLALLDEGLIDELAPLAPLPPRRPDRPATPAGGDRVGGPAR